MVRIVLRSATLMALPGPAVQNRVRKLRRIVVGFALTLLVPSSPVGAVTLGANLDAITLGAAVTPSLANHLLSSTPVFEDKGTLTTQVYSNGALYTYLAVLQPKVSGISIFSTAFSVAGLTGSMGWSFSQAAANGADTAFPGFVTSANIFTRSVDGGIVKFTVNALAGALCPPSCFWTTPDPSMPGYFLPITFFFQSTLSPGTDPYATDTYGSGSRFAGFGYAPATSVPEPTTLLLLSSGIIAVLGWHGRWRLTRRLSRRVCSP